MRASIRKFALGSCMFASAGGVAYGCGCPPVADGVWIAAMEAASLSVSAALITATEAIAAARVVNMQLVQSSMRVLTKQLDSSSSKMSVAQLSSKQAAAAFSSELADRKAVFQTTMEYNPVSGQGYDPCGELTRTKKVAVALGEANSSMEDRVLREIEAAPGRVVADPSVLVSKRLELARNSYCTADEAKSGVCGAPGQLAGKDLDAAHFFTSYPAGSPEAAAKNAMLNHMYGVPSASPPGESAKTPEGQAFFAAKRQYDTFRSVSQASMKAIQSWTESRDGMDSVLESLGKKIDTYSGAGNYGDWEKTLAAQSEHGLMVELAKKRAMQLFVNNLEYQQFERIEANVAALVAMKAQNAPTDSDAAKFRAGAVKVR